MWAGFTTLDYVNYISWNPLRKKWEYLFIMRALSIESLFECLIFITLPI